ncbi:nucleotidyltransferase family protein [Arenicella sp. 4NH20-0111]|uniref:nucleotidyltransferase family protein n=1 Tax=Arenicella sp. 4NH20-0111 TaxID=3127648 RepID=UPI003107ED75
MPLSPEQTTVVLLAAGHGKRMQPLTDNVPKPLLELGSHTLIEHHLLRLRDMNFRNVVINVAYLASKIKDFLGDGSNHGLDISYSDESDTGALETAGGIKNALSLIQSDTFITINADIWTRFEFTDLLTEPPEYAKLIMVENPEHNRNGDFAIDSNGRLSNSGTKLTFSGIASYRKTTFAAVPYGKQALAPIFRDLITKKKLEGSHYVGDWVDVGTPERLMELRQKLQSDQA